MMMKDGFTLVTGKKVRFANDVKLMRDLAPPRNPRLLRLASEILLRSLSLLNGKNCVSHLFSVLVKTNFIGHPTSFRITLKMSA